MRYIKITVLLTILPFFSQAQNFTIEYGDDLKYSRIAPEAIDDIRTIEFWFKLKDDYTETALSPQAFIQREDQSGPDQNEFGINLVDFIGRKGHLEFNFNGNKIKSDQNYWRADNWYHVAGVIDPNEGMKLYVHGVEQFETDPYNIAIYPTSDTTFLGTWGFKRYRDLEGQLDELKLWSRALSQEEIVENMCRGLDTSKVEELAAYYKFEFGNGDTTYDYSGNGYHTAVNDEAWEDDNTCYVSGIPRSNLYSPLKIHSGPGNLYLQLSTDYRGENAVVALFDITGREVLRKKVKEDQGVISIPTRGLPKAPIMVKLISNSGIYSGKTIIR